MKTRGLQNAINRLKGARKFGSASLLAQADAEARHTLTQARAWLVRTPIPADPEKAAARDAVQRITEELAGVIG